MLDFEPDELLSIALIEIEHLLRAKYDPTRATVTSFLSGWLFNRVRYATFDGYGLRRGANRRHRPVDFAPPARDRTTDPSEASNLVELAEHLKAAGYSTEVLFHDDLVT